MSDYDRYYDRLEEARRDAAREEARREEARRDAAREEARREEARREAAREEARREATREEALHAEALRQEERHQGHVEEDLKAEAEQRTRIRELGMSLIRGGNVKAAAELWDLDLGPGMPIESPLSKVAHLPTDAGQRRTRPTFETYTRPASDTQESLRCKDDVQVPQAITSRRIFGLRVRSIRAHDATVEWRTDRDIEVRLLLFQAPQNWWTRDMMARADPLQKAATTAVSLRQPLRPPLKVQSPGPGPAGPTPLPQSVTFHDLQPDSSYAIVAECEGDRGEVTFTTAGLHPRG